MLELFLYLVPKRPLESPIDQLSLFWSRANSKLKGVVDVFWSELSHEIHHVLVYFDFEISYIGEGAYIGKFGNNSSVLLASSVCVEPETIVVEFMEKDI